MIWLDRDRNVMDDGRIPCPRCGHLRAVMHPCADDTIRWHCVDCTQDCKPCAADQDEQRQVDAARKGE